MYPFRVLVDGTTMRGRKFTREQLLTGAVWKGGDNPPPTTMDDPQHGKDELCKLLSCLLGEKVLQPEFAAHCRPPVSMSRPAEVSWALVPPSPTIIARPNTMLTRTTAGLDK